MDRGHHTFARNASLIAVLASLTLVSFSDAAESDAAAVATAGVRTVPKAANVVRADGALATANSGNVRQVVGKQPSSQRRRSGGPFNLFGGPSQPSSRPTPSQTTPSQPSTSRSSGRGILDGLFGSRNNSSKKSSGTAAVPQNPGSAPLPDSVDWEGIPYHQAQSSRNGGSASAPIRDPSAARSKPTPTVARSTRKATAAPSLPRPSSNGTRVVRSNTDRTVNVPTPASAEPKVASISKPSLSSKNSSRRSRTSTTSDISSTVKTMAKKRAAIRSDSSIDDLVPKVSRRSIATTAAPKATKTATPTPAASNTGSSRRIAKAEATSSAAKKPEPAVAASPKPVATPRTVAEPTPSVEVAAAKPAPRLVAQPTLPAMPAPDAEPTPAIAAAPAVQTDTSPAKLGAPQPRPAYAASQPEPARTTSPAVPTQLTVPSNTVSGNVAGFQPGHRNMAAPMTLAHPQGLPTTQGTVAQAPDPYGKAVDSFRPVDPYANVTGSASRELTGAGSNAPRIAAAPQTVQNPAPTKMTLDSSRTEPLPSIPAPSAAPAPAMSSVTNDFRTSAAPARNFATRKMLAGETAVASEMPSIRVVTHGPSEMMIRQTRAYEIRVENRGSIDADGVLVRAQIPDWAELKSQSTSVGDVETNEKEKSEQLVWTIDRLPAGKSETMTVQLKAARSGLYDLDVDWTLIPQHTIAKIRVQQPKLTLTIDGPDEVVFGESETYKVRVLNPGDGIAPDVVFTLSPNSATPQSQQIGNIPAGKEAQFEVELTANDLGDLRIHGLAAGDLELRAEAEKVIRVSAAKLEAMLSGPELKYQNAESRYHLELQNTGTATSEKVVATLQLPNGVKYIGGLEGATVTGNQLRWTIDAMSPKSIREYDFQCMMTSTGEQVFAFDCRGTAAGQAEVSLGTNVQAIADLVLSVNDPPAPAPIGSDVTYEIVIRNRGSKEARDVRAIAQFSHGIEPLRVQGQSGEVLTGQVLFDPIDRIAPGQELRLQVLAKAEREGHHRFRTEVRSGDIVLLAEEATHYMNPRSDRVSRRSSDAESR